MGEVQGHAIRFGAARDIVVAGEGLETVLSLKTLFPGLPMWSCLSANHLGLVLLPEGLSTLIIPADNDAAGLMAAAKLSARAHQRHIAVSTLIPQAKDFNDDLRLLGRDRLTAAILSQLAPELRDQFIRALTCPRAHHP
jgi:hypothetical protein